jgi:hypothetical protein
MNKVEPKLITCPVCGRTFTSRMYRNHMNSHVYRRFIPVAKYNPNDSHRL